MEELISVVLPVYNVEKYLNNSLDSVIAQTYKNIEIILVDDGSTDKSSQICNEYKEKDDRIIVIHKKNGGLSDARNSGIKIASGKYITFIDSDDYVKEDYIEYLYRLIKKDVNCKMSICSHSAIYDNGTILDKSTGEELILDKEVVLERILYHDGIDLSSWAKLYDIELFKDIKFPLGRLFEDAATTYKLIDKCEKISCGQTSKYCYIIRNNSITNEDFSLKKMDLIISTKEMCEYIERKYPNLKQAAKRRLVYAYLSTITQLAKSKKKFKEQEKEMIKFIRENSKDVLKDRRTPKRDKIAIISLCFGMNMYKFMWKCYSKITGRI